MLRQVLRSLSPSLQGFPDLFRPIFLSDPFVPVVTSEKAGCIVVFDHADCSSLATNLPHEQHQITSVYHSQYQSIDMRRTKETLATDPGPTRLGWLPSAGAAAVGLPAAALGNGRRRRRGQPGPSLRIRLDSWTASKHHILGGCP